MPQRAEETLTSKEKEGERIIEKHYTRRKREGKEGGEEEKEEKEEKEREGNLSPIHPTTGLAAARGLSRLLVVTTAGLDATTTRSSSSPSNIVSVVNQTFLNVLGKGNESFLNIDGILG